ncbi:MAG: hypothetical protein IKN12_06215 [Selenomonadaceae bacterium]|nr:hypothetical protein [Selenomonadaceae bacterium]MBR3722344.1 hypothetical protein [Selenomonadaceae bacterium]
MSAVTQSNIVSPMVEEAYRLLGKLNESQLIVIVNSIKKFIEENRASKDEKEEIRRKEEAFAELLELRKKFAATEPKSYEEERFEAMKAKYSFL